jgi:hypothetical protein
VAQSGHPDSLRPVTFVCHWTLSESSDANVTFLRLWILALDILDLWPTPGLLEQGRQMVCFQPKNPNLGKLWRILVYFITIWSILRPFKIFYGHSVYFVVIWYIFPRFGILDQDKTGNPTPEENTFA